MIYLDANVFIYALFEPEDSPFKIWAQKLLLGKNTATSALTWDEVVHYARRHIDKEEAIKTAKGFLRLHTIILPVNRETISMANDYYPTLDPRDSIHLACMKQNGIKTIATKDNDFKKIKGIEII